MDKRYEAYCLTDPFFYDSPRQLRTENFDFELARSPVPEGWDRSELEDWVVYRPEKVQLPPQGWKIHASACLDDAEEILSEVRDYCVPRRISFKFLRGRHALLMANAKYADRGSSGKFVTIYPVDDVQLELVLKELGEVLDGQRGPYILSDLRWGDGPLYVRYGGFVDRYCVSSAGALEPAIADPSGRLVPDLRGPTFQPPAWVELPEFLAPHLAARNATTVEGIPYRIKGVLHFSNGGGLYTGEDVRTGERVVLKEARPYAGLSMDGTDAVTRLAREREILQRLDGLDVVPRLRDWLTVDEHRFLVEEFVDGTPLYSLLARRYPLVEQQTDEREAAEYASWALDVYGRVESAVAALHDRGVVVGDLHPYNILVQPDGRVVLIDFEGAAHATERRRAMLGAPGFAAPADRRGTDVDRYALACLRLSLFLPLTALLGIDAAKSEHLAAEIDELFPTPQGFLTKAVQVINGASAAHSAAPRLDPDHAGWERARGSMARAVLASATPERDDRLFPGDIEQFETGGLNIAHGAAGVLYALDATGAGRHPAYEEWFVRRATRPGPGTRPGFYDGLHGIAYVLEHLGHRAEALRVLGICSDELGKRWEELGLDLYGGLAGIGLNLAHFAAATGDPSLREAAFRVADVVSDRLGEEESVPTVSGGEHPSAGLLRGSSGPALMFVRLYDQTGESGLLELARTALGQDLRRCVVRGDGYMEVNEGWRTMPYLAEGSVGIGLVLDDYLAHRDDERFAEAAAAIRRAAKAQFYVEPGLFHGRAGMILYLSRAHPPGRAAEDPAVATHIRRLAWHALRYQGHLAFPGEELLRLSMDLGTGTAGVLLAVGAALHDGPVHLPFLGPPHVSRVARTGCSTNR